MPHTCMHVRCPSQVRRSVPKITLPMVLELIEAQEWGPSTPKIPYTAAKERLAHITAAKAVALALTPGLDPIKVRVYKGPAARTAFRAGMQTWGSLQTWERLRSHWFRC